MNTPNRPVPPPVHEMWKTFSLAARGKDPLGTITSLDLRDEEGTKALVGALPAPPVSISDLPSVPVMGTTSAGEPVATDFEIVGVLGEGGMGRVLLARQRSLQRDVALKVLKADVSRRDIVDTLLTEAVITGSIEHPNIVPIHALGRDKTGLPVLVMKRIDGVSWRKLFEQPDHALWPSLCADETYRFEVHLEILMAVCNAVHYAHSRGIVHRDIKLDNVMMGGFGEVYLVDWGIAITRTNKGEGASNPEDFSPPVGTLAYMAPEMAMGDSAKINERTDVYLLGATLHFLLTGRPRHQGETPLELLLSARDSEPFEYGPSVPAELAAICNRAMHVDQEKRFSSALEVRQALEVYQRHRGSLVLSAKAMDQMAALKMGDPIPELKLRRVMTECRFAFMQALEAWPGNQVAREGLDKVLGHMIEYEIEQRDWEGARMLLSELSAPRPDLEAKVEALQGRLDHEKKEAERLKALARNTDLSIGARYQLMIFSTLPICAVLSIFVMMATGRAMLVRQLFIFPAVVTVAVLAVYFVLRKQINTSIARRAFAMVVLYPVSLLVHRIFAFARGDDVPSILMTDMVISAIIAFAFGVAIVGRTAWLSVIFLVGAATIAIFPAHASISFVIFAILGGTGLAAYWVRLVRAEEKAEPN